MTTRQKQMKDVYGSRVKVHVWGTGASLMDMLRYDNCVPDTEEEAHKLARVIEDSPREGDRTITFRRFARTPGPPTIDRWPGFGGKVISWEPLE